MLGSRLVSKREQQKALSFSTRKKEGKPSILFTTEGGGAEGRCGWGGGKEDYGPVGSFPWSGARGIHLWGPPGRSGSFLIVPGVVRGRRRPFFLCVFADLHLRRLGGMWTA